MRLVLLIYFLLAYGSRSVGQLPVHEIPAIYETYIASAIKYFPELNTVSFRVRIKHAHSPLSTRPAFWSIFKKPSKRKYIITISSGSVNTLLPILFQNLPDSAKIGVTGHELSHIVDFQKMKFGGFVRLLFKHYSNKYQDRFEYNTDKICIEHGMGYYLLAWSTYVRKALHIKNWRGADNIDEQQTDCERYMNPATILSFLENFK